MIFGSLEYFLYSDSSSNTVWEMKSETCCWQMDIYFGGIFSLLSKRTIAQILFSIYCFVLGKVLALLGNGQICVLFYVLRISGYISWIHFHIWNYCVILLRQKVFSKTSHDILFANADWGSPSDANHTQISWLYKEMSNPRDGWQ
jgi:hypothetical protein